MADQAIADVDLFERVVAHRQVFFAYNWVDYSTMRRGSIRLLPVKEQLADWAADYEQMQQEMFFGKVPSFDDILAVVGEFKRRFNKM